MNVVELQLVFFFFSFFAEYSMSRFFLLWMFVTFMVSQKRRPFAVLLVFSSCITCHKGFLWCDV